MRLRESNRCIGRGAEMSDRPGQRGETMRWHTTLVVISLFTLLACASPLGADGRPVRSDVHAVSRRRGGLRHRESSGGIRPGSIGFALSPRRAVHRCGRGHRPCLAREGSTGTGKSSSSRRRRTASQGVYDAYRVTLVTLAPIPEVGSTIRPTDYVATMLVTRSP